MNILNFLFKLLSRFPIKTITIAIVVIVGLAVGISNVYMATGNDTLVKTNTDVYQDNLKLEKDFGGESIIVLYEADELLTPNHLAHMKGIENELTRNPSIYSIISPVTLVEEMTSKQADLLQDSVPEIVDGLGEMSSQLIEISKDLVKNPESEIPDNNSVINQKEIAQENKLNSLGDGLYEIGGNLQSTSKNLETMDEYSDIMSSSIPKKQETLDNIIYDEEDNLRSMFEEVVVDDNHMMMMVKFNGNTSDEEKSNVVDMINMYLDNETIDSVDTIVSGKPVLDNSIRTSMQESIQKMMGLALVIMIIVLFFVFKVRFRLLPLITVLIAVVGTIGLMGWLEIPITMVSMAVFPILIGLGIDYAIQFQTRYTEEMEKEDLNE